MPRRVNSTLNQVESLTNSKHLAMSVSTYARVTDQGVSTVYKQIEDKELPAHREGRKIIILVEEAVARLKALPMAGKRRTRPSVDIDSPL